MKYFAVSCWFVVLVSGCSMSKMVANNVSGTMTDMKASFFADDSPDHAMASGPAMLKMLDGFIVSSPKNVSLLQSGAEMNCAFSQTFLEDDHRDWAIRMYRRGKSYGLRGLAIRYPELHRALTTGDEAGARTLLPEVKQKDLPLLFWTGICWGGEINMVMEAALLPDLPLVEAMMARTGELDSSYYFGAVNVFYGTYWAGRPELLGGNAEKGRGYFDEALAATQGSFLLWKFMYAKVYAVASGNADLYLRFLQEIMDTPESQDTDENRLANQMARRLAAKWKGKVFDLFPDYVPPQDDLGDEEELDDLDLD